MAAPSVIMAAAAAVDGCFIGSSQLGRATVSFNILGCSKRTRNSPAPAALAPAAKGAAIGWRTVRSAEERVQRNTPLPMFSSTHFSLPCSRHVRWARNDRGRQLAASEEAAVQATEDDEKWPLPPSSSPLYNHSLPAIEKWLRQLGFKQDSDQLADWAILRDDWHANLSMDDTELVVRYLASGPGTLERDIERKFSYALSRQDLENAILAGP